MLDIAPAIFQGMGGVVSSLVPRGYTSMVKRHLVTDSLVAFRNSQRQEAQGTLVHLNRHSVVFEVYNPYSIVQLSEVLEDVLIRRGDRTTYTGKAVVTNLVNTGLMLLVSASLVDPWSDLVHLAPGPRLRDEVDRFVTDWSESNERLLPAFKQSITDLRNFLEELNRWLEHGETVAGINEPTTQPDVMDAFVDDVDAVVGPRLDDLYGQFEEAAAEVPHKSVGIHSGFAQRELHPLMMCSPFIHRTFTKPLGYAGDYEMVNMMLRDPREGNHTFAKVINASALRKEAPKAHRNRIDRLAEVLMRETRRVGERQRDLRVLNVGCGPAAEVESFVRGSWLSDHVCLELMDFNEETLEYAEKRIRLAVHECQRKTQVKFVHRSINDLIQDAAVGPTHMRPEYDMVYCAGLFDYFGDPTCECLLELFYSWTRPGGLVLATNVSPHHSTIGFMKHVLEWNLRLRDQQHMQRISPPDGQCETSLDSTGVNVFLEVRKPMNGS